MNCKPVLAILLAAAATLPAAALDARVKAKTTAFVSPRHQFHFILPWSLRKEAKTVAGWVDYRVDEFMAACYKWQSPTSCHDAVRTSKALIVHDYTFYCSQSPTGLCAGLTTGGNITTILYNKVNGYSPDACRNSFLRRDRRGMYELSGGNAYWLAHGASIFCEAGTDILPALVHEICHAFGAEVGHIAGLEPCQRP
jgi:hypothetical protein